MREIGSLGLTIRMLLQPWYIVAMTRGPRVETNDITTTLDEWLAIDHKQTETIVKAIGCKHPEYHRAQQNLRIDILKRFADTFGKYMRLQGDAKIQAKTAEAELTRQCQYLRMCHRVLGEKSPLTIRCYCDEEHAH